MFFWGENLGPGGISPGDFAPKKLCLFVGLVFLYGF